MPVTMEQVRIVLEPDELNYTQAAELGPDALPYLEELVQSSDAMLASKATYLAGLIAAEGSVNVLQLAARSVDPVVRVAAAGAARSLMPDAASKILMDLVFDDDRGVRRVALKSINQDATPELLIRVEDVSRNDTDPGIRNLSTQVLQAIRRRN